MKEVTYWNEAGNVWAVHIQYQFVRTKIMVSSLFLEIIQAYMYNSFLTFV